VRPVLAQQRDHLVSRHRRIHARNGPQQTFQGQLRACRHDAVDHVLHADDADDPIG
jgi:hypothetical protein